MTKYEYNKQYIANNRDLVNQRRREKYQQDKLNSPVVDKPKQVRRRKPIEDKKTEDIKAYRKAYVEKNKEKLKQKKKEYALKNKEKNKEKIKQQQKEYAAKNKEKIKQQQKEYRERNKEKIEQTRKEYPQPIKQKKYLNNDELFNQIIISKAKCKATPELVDMMIKISTGLARKLTYYNEDDRNDCQAEGLLQMVLNYHNFNEDKYDNAFAYLTEICKRGMAKQFNELHNIKTMYILGSKNKKRETEQVKLNFTNCDWTTNGYNF